MIGLISKLMESYSGDADTFRNDKSFRDRDNVYEEVRLLREILFPDFWNSRNVREDVSALEHKVRKLWCAFSEGTAFDLHEKSEDLSMMVLQGLPEIRELLKMDVEAAYKGDPAAKGYSEIIRSYPGFLAITVHRVSNLLYGFGAFAYARELSESAHSVTGTDIHPGAKVGRYFFIDHATGVVIGETAEIGDWVRVYQGVTLGVFHFEKDGNVLKKGYKRHPTIGSHVVIGANASIYGPITIGDHVNIGAGSKISTDIPAYTTVFPPRSILEKRSVEN